MTKSAKRLYEFGPYRVDAADRLLLKEGKVVPLPPKVFDILLTFVERSGRVLDKDELMQEVWPDTFVEEGNLARNVSTLRATVPCASVACSSSSRFSEGAADLKIIDSVLERWTATISSLP